MAYISGTSIWYTGASKHRILIVGGPARDVYDDYDQRYYPGSPSCTLCIMKLESSSDIMTVADAAVLSVA